MITAIEAASADVRRGLTGPVPPHLRDAHYPGAKKVGHGTSYAYAHDAPYGIAEQQYAPDELLDAEYYRPTSHGRGGGGQGALGAHPAHRAGTIGSIAMGWPFWAVVCLLVAMTALVVTLGVLFAGERRRGRAERAALLAEQRQLSERVEELSRAATAQRQIADEHADWVITRLGESEDDGVAARPVSDQLVLSAAVRRAAGQGARPRPRRTTGPVGGVPQPDPVRDAPRGSPLPQGAPQGDEGGLAPDAHASGARGRGTGRWTKPDAQLLVRRGRRRRRLRDGAGSPRRGGVHP